MSDNLRKGLGEQATEKIQPDSTKSTTEKASQNITGLGDKVASSVQPDDSKSATQKLGDSTRSGADTTQSEGKSYVQQATDAASNVANQGAEAAKNAADYVAGNTKST